MCSRYPRNTDRQVEDVRAPKRLVFNRQFGRTGRTQVADPIAVLDRGQNAGRAMVRPQSDTFDGIETPLGGDDQEFRRLRVSHRPVIIWAHELQAFAVSLVALAAAMVLATKELLLCWSGAALRVG